MQSTTPTTPQSESPEENPAQEYTAVNASSPLGLELFTQLLRPYSSAELDSLFNVPQNRR